MTNKNPQTLHWQQLSNDHHLAPFSDFKQLKEVGPRIVTHAKGVYLWDSEGHKILDGMAGLWCVNVGYGRRELAEVAYQQMLELPYYNNFFKSTHPPAVELSSMLAEVTPGHMSRVFYTNSGSEANDTVVRMVRRYWDIRGQAEKQIIISRENAYHGSTMAGASLGGMKPMHAQGGLPIPGIVHIGQPYWYQKGGDQTPEEFGLKAARLLEEKILELGVDKVAAFIAEPVQGAGGVIVPPQSYWPEIKRICDAYDILLVVDEVICGFGRTGQWFGSDYYDLKPDLMPIAKGLSSGYLPIGGVMVADHISETLLDGGDFNHGFTYSGHPVAAAVALANINILRDEGIVETVDTTTAPYLAERWKSLESHPLVGEARSIGLMGALELVKDKSRRQRFDKPGTVGTICRDFCFDNGLVMRAVEDTMIISPPLIINTGQIDEMIDIARKCLDLTAAELGMDH
ncbi:MAG: aspartate aminotransferase family protein [Gammaproteobacteria bacterium]|nr:aspartate aminotransferase family protein [Gammaproteobacteria bacterium]